MGEHADAALDDFLFGRSFDEGPDEWAARPITCRGCGEAGLHWYDLNRDTPNPRAPLWRLFDHNNQPHRCKPNPEADKLAEGFLRRHKRNKLPIY